ncbi:MAG: ParB/RepB/Spo0J family partition protein [Thermodesulfobacteriota bacterium]
METIKKIPLSQIDQSDETFSVNFMPDLQSLRTSIEEIDLIQPVLLREKADRYQVVCGFRRISIFHELGRMEIESKIFGEKEVDDFRLFSISLHENLTTRGFNTVEKAIALDKLIRHFQIDPRIVIKDFLPLFSLEPNEKILNTFLSLARMKEEVKRYVLKGEISRSNIRRLSTFTHDDQMALISLFSFLKLGENRLREMLTLLEEISQRNQARVRDIVHRPEIQNILSQKELTMSQRTARVKKVLVDLRYPRMRQMEEEFEKQRRALNLPPGVTLRYPSYFEGKGWRVEFQFETVEEYKAILSTLSQLVDRKEFQEILRST